MYKRIGSGDALMPHLRPKRASDDDIDRLWKRACEHHSQRNNDTNLCVALTHFVLITSHIFVLAPSRRGPVSE